jgi:hypothetical protein
MLAIILILLLLYLIQKTNVNKEIIIFLISIYFLNYLNNNYFKKDMIEGFLEETADFFGAGDVYRELEEGTAETWCPPKHGGSLLVDWRQTVPGATTQCNALRYQFDENWFKGEYDGGDDNEVCREHVNDSSECDDEGCSLSEDGRCIPNWIRHIKEAVVNCSSFKDNNLEDGCETHKEIEDDNVGPQNICRWIADEDGVESCEYIYGSKYYDETCASSLTLPDCSLSDNETSCSHPLCEWIPPVEAVEATDTEPAVEALPGGCSDRSLEPLEKINTMKNLCDSRSLESVGDSENSCHYRLECNDDDGEEHICEYQTATSDIYPSEYEDDMTETPCGGIEISNP